MQLPLAKETEREPRRNARVRSAVVWNTLSSSFVNGLTHGRGKGTGVRIRAHSGVRLAVAAVGKAGPANVPVGRTQFRRHRRRQAGRLHLTRQRVPTHQEQYRSESSREGCRAAEPSSCCRDPFLPVGSSHSWRVLAAGEKSHPVVVSLVFRPRLLQRYKSRHLGS